MASAADSAQHDPTSPFVLEVIELYREETLAQARFPGLDCEVLLAAQRALLETQLELERCEAQLAAAKAALVAQLESLESKAERALGYARVFATGDPELTARLAEVGRKKPILVGERAPPRRRGRPKQNARDAKGEELFAVGSPAAEGGATAPGADSLVSTPSPGNGHARRSRERESLSL
jgi:multidrug efflux pump subunit AcrA (membrane-fusion protein)